MLSKNSCLSPYQLEYLLKESSRNIYDTAENAYLFNINRWNSRAGAGALDANKSVYNANYLSCNDPASQTMFIDGVELNTVCAPGYSSNSVSPKLVPVISNGTPPYRYNWEPIYSNTTTLDDPAGATPTIIAATGTRLAYYRLTVYDASDIQKVANRIIRIQLDTANTYDLAMRDSYLDMLDEPNSQGMVDPREWNIWYSPDLWNRKTQDDVPVYENIEYFSNGDPDYMYVRVRNVGCAAYDNAKYAAIRAYWSLASTGESWPNDWTTTMVTGVNGLVSGGQMITTGNGIHIPDLQPGDNFVAAIPWNPINPEQYAGGPTSVDVCGLARIFEPTKSNRGITFSEVTHTGTNITNNNNIVTRNMTLVNLGHKYPASTHRVYIANADSLKRTFTVQMITDKDIFRHFAGNLSQYLYVTLKLQPDLYNAWQAGGFKGSYATLDKSNYTVTYDPSSPLRLDSITLAPGDKFYADLKFQLRDSVIIDAPINGQRIHIRQLYNDGKNTDRVYGDVSYTINVADDQDAAARKAIGNSIKQARTANITYSVSPNPFTGKVNIRFAGDKEINANIIITDVKGRIIKKQGNVYLSQGNMATIALPGLLPGIYLINIKDDKGSNQTLKIIKAE